MSRQAGNGEAGDSADVADRSTRGVGGPRLSDSLSADSGADAAPAVGVAAEDAAPAVDESGRTRPTRRGVAVAAVVVLGVVLSGLHGARSLNAVVLAGGVGLLAAALQLRAAGEPTVERTLPPDGFQGQEGTVRLRFSTEDPTLAAVRDWLPAGVAGDGSAETTVGTEPVEYDVEYVRRGRHAFGPVGVTATDVLGLLERRFVLPAPGELVVYPPAWRLSSGAEATLRRLYEPGRSNQRDEFDRLREYAPGDPLRDVDWKASAKRDELVVAEFAGRSATNRVTVAAGTTGTSPTEREREDAADRMAAAATTVCLSLLDAGAPVTLRTPSGTVEPDPGESRRDLLEHLATADGGPVPDDDATVVIRAGADGTALTVGELSMQFEAVAAGSRGGPDRAAGEARGDTDDADGDGGGDHTGGGREDERPPEDERRSGVAS